MATVMESVLVDTDVFSFLLKRDTRRQFYRAFLEGKRLCLSFQSLAELKRWALHRNWGSAARRRLSEALRHYVIVPFDASLANAWAEITVARQRLGHPIECGDCWIAATAVRHRMPLVTHNVRDYADIPELTLLTQTGPQNTG
jgi:tRNA(fMet)-specific endonuclease VapC